MPKSVPCHPEKTPSFVGRVNALLNPRVETRDKRLRPPPHPGDSAQRGWEGEWLQSECHRVDALLNLRIETSDKRLHLLSFANPDFGGSTQGEWDGEWFILSSLVRWL